MPEFDKKMQALKAASLPKITGHIVAEAEDAVVLQAGACVVEIPRRHIAEQAKKGHEAELILKGDAEILVSTTVSVQKGFVAENVFGALLPGILACNCNCNCNCDVALRALADNCNCNCNCSGEIGFEGVVEVPAGAQTVRLFRKPFTGGAKRGLAG